MITCDACGNGAVRAIAIITTEKGILELCQHHLNKYAQAFEKKGYDINLFEEL
jgi:hypothetical protein